MEKSLSEENIESAIYTVLRSFSTNDLEKKQGHVSLIQDILNLSLSDKEVFSGFTELRRFSTNDLNRYQNDEFTKELCYTYSRYCTHEVLNCSTESLNTHGENDCTYESDESGFDALSDSKICSDTPEVQVLEKNQVQEIKNTFSACKKNPNHTQFISLNNFGLKHLPSSCRGDDLHELIKAVSRLTVRIAVENVSHQRPQFWLDGQRLPGYRVRFGSGRIEHVTRCTGSRNNACPCKECRVSLSPKQSWGLVRVSTAAHVVFDDPEAKHTTCRLFYDNETSPVVDIEVIKVDTSDVKSDVCKLICVSCDMSLVTQLEQMVDSFISSWEKAFDHYYEDEIFAQEKLAVIVSHPHGYYKHISIGHWKENFLETGNETVLKRFTYDTPTCPGSAGAYVLIPDFNN